MAKTDLTGRVAIVTGASRGIGEAAARSLAEAGASVLLAARSAGDCERIAEEIEAAGGKAIAIACDVADFMSVDRAAGEAHRRFGPVDILVNNAGLIEPISFLSDSDPAGWARVVDVNLKGVYNAMRSVLPSMTERGSGVIINISSGAATSPLEGWSHYCATKAAVLMLTRCAHREVAGTGVRVVGLSPGTVATDMQRAIKASGVNPVSRLDWDRHIPPEWVGRAVAFLASDSGVGYEGGDFSLKTEEGRRAVGLPMA